MIMAVVPGLERKCLQDAVGIHGYTLDELAELLNSSYIFPSNTRITVMQTKDSGQVTSAQQ